MEPRGTVAHYTPGDRRYTIYTPTQRPHGYRAEMADILNVPENDIRIITGDTGGSFGMKAPVFNEAPMCAYASKLTGRPVKWTSTRTEGFLSDAQARDNVTEAELALDKDGLFLALRVKTFAAAGAYIQPNFPAYFLNAGTLAGTYRTPAIIVDTSGVLSNTNPVRPNRGNGRPEAAYVIERMVELAAKELGIDSTELRRRNYISPREMPFKTGLTFIYDCGEFEKNMDLAMKAADFEGFEKRRTESRKNGKLRGIGLSNTIERAAAPSTEGAEVRFDKSGTVTLFVGSNTQGQGHETVFKQIVADRLGLSPDDIRYVSGDTDLVFHGEGTGGSRSATMGGSASLRATDKVIEKATAIAAHAFKVAPEDIRFADGVFSSPKTNQTKTIKEIAADAQLPAKIPPAMEPGLSANAVHTTPVNNYPNGCHICEVEIDIETGVTNVVRYTVVDDVGTVLNPMLLHGQIHGGVVQGVGQALMENIHFDSTGQLLTASFMDYAMPRARTICPMKVESNPVPTRTNPLGTKGAGEAGCVGGLPAVVNAVVDALKDYGVTHVEMPATPERLWRIIHAAS
jgi:carbon-monoxide dehydrogenase large subunit